MLAHIDKEDNVLYPMGDSRFSKETQEAFHENADIGSELEGSWHPA